MPHSQRWTRSESGFFFGSRTDRFATRRSFVGCIRRADARRRFQPCGASSPPATPVPYHTHCAGSSSATTHNPIAHKRYRCHSSTSGCPAPHATWPQCSANRRCNSATCIVVCSAASERCHTHRPVLWLPSPLKQAGEPARCCRSRCRCTRRSRKVSNRIRISQRLHPARPVPVSVRHGHRDLARSRGRRTPVRRRSGAVWSGAHHRPVACGRWCGR